MSDFENPYKSPETAIETEKPQSGSGLNETMLGYLKEASPWMRFIGILGFIGAGLFCVIGIISAIFSTAFFGSIEGLESFPIGVFSLFYIAGGALYFFPARFAYFFGAKIRDYQISGSDEDMELAFKNNKSLWKFLGIMCIVLLAFAPVFIIISIVTAAVTAASLIN
jgi:hypothetical protein